MKDLDKILKQALSPNEHADTAVIDSIRKSIKEETNMENKKVRNYVYPRVCKVAAVFALIALVGGGSVFAAEKLKLFDSFFVGGNEEPIASYIADIDDAEKEKLYEGNYDDYKITVEKMLYCDETNYGMVQFSVKDMTGKGRQWCRQVEYVDELQSWDLSNTLELMETSDGDKSPEFYFQIGGMNNPEYNLYGTKVDDNITVCQMVYGSFNYGEMNVDDISLVVKHDDNGVTKDVLKLSVPVGESLPCYVWTGDDGKVRLKLSSVNYMLFDAPAEDIVDYKEGHRDILPNDVSVKMKDGSEYILYSETRKVMHELHGCKVTLAGLEGNWHPFDRVLDLEKVQSFQVDGLEFNVSEAEMK